jgi:ABC-type nitrate/sulfonate/bicarbonate transport system permease component
MKRVTSALAAPAGRFVLGLLGVVTALAVWYLATVDSTNIYFPALDRIVAEAAEYWTSEAGVHNLLASLKTLFAGLAIAIVVGIVIGQLSIVERVVSPALEFVRAIPATALIPFAMMLFGVGTNMKIFLIALGCVWPVLLSTADGARAVDRTLADSARAFQITGLQRQRYIVLPATTPRILVGIRIAIPIGLILMVTSEMVGSREGLGYVITQAQSSFRLLEMWSGILLLGVLGFVLTFLYSLLERRLRRAVDPLAARD